MCIESFRARKTKTEKENLCNQILLFFRFLSGEKWRAHRKLIAPTFHLNVLKSFINIFNKNSRSIVDKMRKLGSKEFDIHEYMGEATVEILLGMRTHI